MIRFPENTQVNMNVPKNAFYKHLEVSAKMKRIFVDDIDSILWAYKFAPSTLNLSDGRKVHEIAVFVVRVKTMDCPMEMFVFLDNNIPRHTLFLLLCEEKGCIVINYKEDNNGNTLHPYKVSKTYQSNWIPREELSLKLEGNTMDSLYESLVRQVAGKEIISESSSLKEDIIISQQQESIKKEIASLKRKISLERQPQKKFMLHKQLKELENKLK